MIFFTFYSKKIKKMSRVFFAENAKKHDGSSEEIYKQYCIIGSFFGLKEIKKNNKVGITYDELDIILKEHEEEAKSFEPIFANYLKYKIRMKQSLVKNDRAESIKLLPIKSSLDCMKVTDNKLDTINNVIENLRKTLLNIREIKYENNDDENEINMDDRDEEWEKSCEAPICLTKKCCIEKKIKILKKKRVSLIRNGSRDYNFVLEIKHEKYIEYLISLLNDAKNAIENEILEKEWVVDVGLGVGLYEAQ